MEELKVNDLRKKVSLVTGGAGFIGSHIVDRLLALDHKVIVIDNESSDGHDQYHWNPKARNYKYDICDFAKIVPLFAGVDYVFHLAAKVSVQESYEDPIPTFSVNSMGTANVLEASRISNVGLVIYSSTSSVYGNAVECPISEDCKEDPLNTYSIGKLSGEQLCRSYYNLYGLKSVIFRYANVYGERSRHMGSYAPVVTKFLNQQKAQLPLTIYGSGRQKRDFIHVNDVVNVNVLPTFQNLDEYAVPYNIGSGSSFTIQEIADRIMISDEHIHMDYRPGEMRDNLLDISRVQEHLTWKPKVDIMDWIDSQMSRSHEA